MKVKRIYIVCAVLGVLVITNPSRSSFASYLHTNSTKGIGRVFNGIIFSVYSDKYSRGKDASKIYEVYYIGFLGNFFKVITGHGRPR